MDKQTYDIKLMNCCFCDKKAEVQIITRYVPDFVSRIPLCRECREKYFVLEGSRWRKR